MSTDRVVEKLAEPIAPGRDSLTRSERAAVARAAMLRGGVGGDAIARALAHPDTIKDEIRAATLANALGALSPDTLMSDADRLKAIEVGAKVSGLTSDAPVVVVQTVAMAFGKLGGAVDGE